MSTIRLDPVERAVIEIAEGRPVVVVDDEDRENEGDLIFAAAAATPDMLAMTVRYSSGIICAPMSGARLDRLELPLMVEGGDDPLRTAFTVSVDAREGVTTGISAADRARTLRLLSDPAAAPQDLTRPGHIFPLRARPGGVLERRGHTEAAVDLMALAGQSEVGALVELVHDDGTMMRAPALREFADHHGLVMISIDALAEHRRARTRTEISALELTEPVHLPTRYGEFHAIGVRERRRAPTPDPGDAQAQSAADGPAGPPMIEAEHLVLLRGDVTTADPVITRVHSECVTGDVLGSLRCDCGPQLEESLSRIDDAGRGVLVLLRGHEGRGIGLVEKLHAYALQESGRDTVDANLELGLPVDARSYAVVPRILEQLGIRSVHLLTHNPAKAEALRTGGIEVASMLGLSTHPTTENLGYLTTKRDRLGHHLIGLPPRPGAPAAHLADPVPPGARHKHRDTTSTIGDTA